MCIRDRNDSFQRPGIIRIVGVFRGDLELQGAAGGNFHPLETHHLDVYKRQVLPRCERAAISCIVCQAEFPAQGKNLGIRNTIELPLGVLGTEAENAIIKQEFPVPVSYTHLDVYKRQVLGRASEVILPIALAIGIFSIVYFIYYQVTKHSCYKAAIN